MIISLTKESRMVSDYEAPEIPEQPIIIINNTGSEGISLIGWDGDQIFIPYRIVKEVTKVMNAFSTPKKKSK